MKKDAYYFPHFSNARSDSKILKVRRVLGVEGYGIYFMLLEVLRDQKDFKYPLEGVEDLAFEFHISKEKVMSVINDFDLFEVDTNQKFFSPKQMLYLEPYIEKSKKARMAANKRWEKVKGKKELPEQCERNADALQSQSTSNARRGEESKVNETKVNKSKKDKNEKSKDFSASIHELYAKVIEEFEAEEIPATKAQKRKWLETLEKLQRLDGKTEEEIYNVVKWCKNHDFWSGNFHSVVKLRRKDKDGLQFFKRFVNEMKKEKSSAKKEKNNISDESFKRWLEM